MAEKMANSIGRELRYFEYKFRKKQHSSKKGKKTKNDGTLDGQLAWSDAPGSDDFNVSPKNEELQKAMPGSKGEEELQVQVALAMSREEEHERARQSESDKVRLEMALKESIGDASPKPQPSLLDMSLTAPKPATAPVPSLGAGNPFGATNDPWGGAPASVPAPAPTYDPFAPQQQNAAQPIYATVTKPFPPQNDAWGIPQATAVPPPQDPWGGAQSSFNPQPVQTSSFPTPQANNAWGNPTPSLFDTQTPAQNAFPPAQNSLFDTQTPAQNAFPLAQNGLFDTQTPAQNAFPPAQNGLFDTQTPAQNAFPPAQNGLFDTQTPAQNAFPPAQNGTWGNSDHFSSSQPVKFDPFAENSTIKPTQPQMNAFNMSAAATPFTAPPFDPLQDFNSLRIGVVNPEPAPVILQNDFGNGKSVAKDLFPLGGVLEPEYITPSSENGLTAAPMMTKKETDLFLGENSSLVNLESGWKTYQVPYCTKPLGTVTHNPFQPSGPVKTLNQMKHQPSFT